MKQKYTNIGLPKHLLKMASEKELDYIETLCAKRITLKHKLYTMDNYVPARRDIYVELGNISDQLAGFRKLIRQRYSNSFKEGIYTITRSNVFPVYRIGEFDFRKTYRNNIPKKSILTWVSRDELGTNWFLLKETIVGVTNGASIDSLIGIKDYENRRNKSR